MAEYRLFDPENPPPWLDPEWWRHTENCNHLAHPAGVHQARIEFAAKLACIVARSHGLSEIVDIGAGDGALLSYVEKHVLAGVLPNTVERTGYEIIDDSRRFALEDRHVWINGANVTEEALTGQDTAFTRHVCKATRGGRLVVATEFLEHLADPHAMVRWLSDRTEWLLVSSPWGETPDRHEDNHAWAWDHEGYASLLCDNGFGIVSHSDVEWSQLIVARRVGASGG